MDAKTKTVVTFQSTAFNMSEAKDYFINASCFGDALAKWLIGELRKQGVKTGEKPHQEDFGWCFNFEVREVDHTFVIGHRPSGESETGIWIGWIERRYGFVESLLGGRQRGIQHAAVEVIHKILSNSSLISDLRWQFQRDFDEY